MYIDVRPRRAVRGNQELSHYNILYITESYTTHDRRFLSAAGQRDVNLWFACIESPGEIGELPANVSLWPGINKPLSDWHVLISELKIHAIHAGPCSSVLPLVVSSNFSCAIIGMSWGRDVLADIDVDIDLQSAVMQALQKIDAIIVDCDAVIDKICELLPDNNLRFFKFPWGIDLDKYKRLPKNQFRKLRQGLNWTDHTVFISTRSWDVIYGIESLIDAFDLLVKDNPDVRLLLIGDGPLRSRILSQIKAKNIGDYIHIPGRIQEDELNKWYASADIYVSSSLCDGSSVSMLEAMACGLPVVVHNRHGNKEWVRHNENGWLTNCESINDLFLSMNDAAHSREKWKEMGQKNINQARNAADWRNNSHSIVDAYEYAYGIHAEVDSGSKE